jgi:hypothetical protein
MNMRKEWDSYKMEVVIRKCGKYLLRKWIRKKKLFLRLSLKWSMYNHMKDSKKNPTIYQFPVLVTGICNVSAFKPPLRPWEENYVLIPNSNLCSICAVVFKVKECILKIRKIQKKIANLKLWKRWKLMWKCTENCMLRKENIGRSWTPHIHFHSQRLLKTEFQPFYLNSHSGSTFLPSQ